MAALSLLISLTFLPVLAGFYYSYQQDIFSLSGSLLFVILFSIMLFIATSRLNKWLAFALNLFFFLTMLVFEIMRAISFYLQGEGFNERFFFHLTLSTIKDAGLNYPELFWLPALLFIGITVLIFYISQKRLFQQSSLLFAISLLVITLFPFPASAIKQFVHYKVTSISDRNQSWSIEQVKALGLNTQVINQTHTISATPGRNLVLIYMESLESIYTDESIFKSLTPNLNQTKQTGAWFSDIQQMPGTSWTVSGIAASLCGSPLLYDSQHDGNDILAQGFFDQAICLPDILHAAGYKQSYLGGATLNFAGKGTFLKKHHYDDVNGLHELLPEHNNPDYLTNWGLYDDTLLDIAVNKFNTLADGEQPFNLTLLTLDSHHPKGHPSASCMPYREIDNSILHAVHCTDQLLKRFIQRISKHPAWKKTTLVLMSDHLAMRNEADKYYPQDYDRKMNLLVLNSQLHGEIATPGSHMDIAPSLLELLNVQHNIQFLAGHSLLNTVQRPEIHFQDHHTRSAFKYINTQFLSTKQNQLCPDDQMVIRTLPDHLLIGNKKVSLTHTGNPFDQKMFNDKLAILAFINQNQQIQESFVVEKDRVPMLVKHNPEQDYILITANQNKTSAWHGNQSGIALIGQANTLKALDLTLASCLNTLKTASVQRQALHDLEYYSQKCAQIDSNQQPAYSFENQTLTLPDVFYIDKHYQVTLKKDGDTAFFLAENYQPSLTPDTSYNYCKPILTEDTLFIPQINIAGQNHELILRPPNKNSNKFMIPKQLQGLFNKKPDFLSTKQHF